MYINVFAWQNKLYISGSYEKIDGKDAQGLSYFDGADLTILNIFPKSNEYNVNAEPISKNELLAYFYVADGNDLSKSRLFILKKDTVEKEITFDCFSNPGHHHWSALAWFNSRYTHAFKMNETIVFPIVNSFLVLNENDKKWETLEFVEWDLDVHFFKGEYILTTFELTFPNETKPRRGEFKIGEVDIYRTFLFADLDEDCAFESNDKALANHFFKSNWKWI